MPNIPEDTQVSTSIDAWPHAIIVSQKANSGPFQYPGLRDMQYTARADALLMIQDAGNALFVLMRANVGPFQYANLGTMQHTSRAEAVLIINE